MATYAQLKKQIEQLSKKAEAALRAEKDEVLAKVREAISSFSLTAEEVFGTKTKKTKSAKPAAAKRVPKGAGQAKYADPKTGATWSGFGRAPAWIASAKDRTKFLVDQQPASTAQAKPKTLKSGAKPKAPSKTTNAPGTKKAAKAPAAAPAKKSNAPASNKTVSKAAASAKKVASAKAKTKTPAPQATAPEAEPAVNAAA